MIQHELCCAEAESNDGPNSYVLNPHPVGFALVSRWNECAVASGIAPCSARSESSGRRCPKDGVVELAVVGDEPLHRPGATVPIPTLSVLLCGGHFGVHRRGKDVRVFLDGE